MKISDELKEKIEDVLKDNTELRDRVLAGDRKAIQEIASIGQENIPPEVIIEAFKNGCEEKIHNLAIKKVEYKKLYFSYANKLLMHSLVLGFSIFILSVNDIKTLIGIVIILLVKIIVYKLEKSKNLLIKCEIINLENKNTLQGYKNANNKAYEYLENRQFYSLLITITIMFVTFIICLLNKSFGQFVIIFMLLKIVDEKLDKIKILNDQKLLFIKHECHYKALINKKEK